MEVEDELMGIDEIEDAELRESVIAAWQMGLDAGNYDSISEILWYPEVAGDDVYHLQHQNDVTSVAISLVDTLLERYPDLDVDRDTVIAGALLHDVSKSMEHAPENANGDEEWVSHPYLAVYLLEELGLSRHLQHVVLAHTPLTSVEPQTLEAEIVNAADEIAATVYRWVNGIE